MNPKDKSFSKTLIFLTLLLAVSLAGGWFLDESGLANLTGGGEGMTLRISEVQNHNALTLVDDDGQASGWIELENTGDQPISLKGVCLTRDSRLNRTLVFPDIALEPGGFLVVYASGSGIAAHDEHIHAPFRLPKSGGHELFLYDAAQRLLDSVEVPAMQADESLCRDVDGQWIVTGQPTPGQANDVAARHAQDVRTGDICVNEIMTRNLALFPDEDGDYPDYVELRNQSQRSVNLEGYWLSDSVVKPNKWRLPSVTLRAGECIAIHCSGKDRRDDPNHLHTNFRLSTDETLLLTSPQGALISMVTLPELEAGQALSWDDGWTDALIPTPGLPNTFDSAVALDARMLAERGDAVCISEVMAAPEDEDFDWVELYNPCAVDVDLSGFGLSDQMKHARKWQFPDGTTIPAGGRLAVALVGSDGAEAAGYLSAPFALSASGGYNLCLSDAEGNILDALYLPQQYKGISYGRGADGALGYMTAPTRMSANGPALKARPNGTKVSTEGGVFSSGDVVSVTLSAEAGDRVYYTLDCSDPDEGKTLYQGEAITITDTTILRTRVYRDGCLPSLMDSQSYLYDVPEAGQVSYIVSLVSDPDNLFSDERGILAMGPNAEAKFPYGDYGEGANFWMDWEREAHVELFNAAGETAISQECGIKVHGRNSRGYELKSLKVKARSVYGDDRFRYPIFHSRPWTDYEAFILRYSGQDYKYTFMRDELMSRQAANTDLMYMEAEECVVYLNGEYYSAGYIRENVSAFSLARKEGWTGQEDSVDLVKSGQQVMQGSNESYQALKDYLRSHDNNTREVYEYIDRTVDLDNFFQYLAVQIVFGTPDTVNVKRYRNAEADGKWRWVVYDFDRGLRGGEDSTDSFALMAQGTNADLYKAVMANDTLRERFLDYLDEAMGSFLSTEALLKAAEEQYARIKPALPRYLEMMGLTEKNYASALSSLKSTIRKRPALVLKHMGKYLKMSDNAVRARMPKAVAAIEQYAAENP